MPATCCALAWHWPFTNITARRQRNSSASEQRHIDMIRVQCASCKVTLTVPDDKAGAEGTCPRCKAKIQIPKKSAAAAKPAPKPAPVAPRPTAAPAPAAGESGLLGDMSTLSLSDDGSDPEPPPPPP